MVLKFLGTVVVIALILAGISWLLDNVAVKKRKK